MLARARVQVQQARQARQALKALKGGLTGTSDHVRQGTGQPPGLSWSRFRYLTEIRGRVPLKPDP